MVKKMAEIKQYYKKMNYEELSLLDSEEFEKLIKNYENHPLLKNLIAKYRKVSSEGYANLARASMRKAPTSIEETINNTQFLTGLSLSREAGELEDEIAWIISNM